MGAAERAVPPHLEVVHIPPLVGAGARAVGCNGWGRDCRGAGGCLGGDKPRQGLVKGVEGTRPPLLGMGSKGS